MNQNIQNKKKLKEKLILFLNTNKKIIYFFLIVLIIVSSSITFIKISNNKTNSLISEKYIQAGLLLSLDEKSKSKKIYEEIINSKNKFYSILALNSILENNLEQDKNKILFYFITVEKLNKSQEQKDLILFKKALYLNKISSKKKEGNKILKSLIKNNSKLKTLAEEIIIE